MREEEEVFDSFVVSLDVACYAKAVIETWPEEFGHLEDCPIGYLLTNLEIVKQGKSKGGYAMLPMAKGEEGKIWYWAVGRMLGFIPDALVVLSREQWDMVADEKQLRVILLFHELYHLQHKEGNRGPCFDRDTGRPVLTMRGHDTEEFFAVAEKFGAWSGNIELFHRLLHKEEGKYGDLDKVVQLAESYCNGRSE